MTNKNSARSLGALGCLTVVAFFVFAPAVILLIGVLFVFIGSVMNGATFGLVFTAIILAVYITLRIVFYKTHQKPITYEQAIALSRRKAKEYAKSNYHFIKKEMVVYQDFKSSLDITGRWYSVNEPLNTFPSLVASLLKWKHHEWVVIAIERDGVVCKMWVNKGDDNQSVSFNCDINEILQMCKSQNGYSILRFHNHPNPDPHHYTTLLASDQDRISAQSCSDVVCDAGYNWFDFVCAQGDYILFFSRYSDKLQIDGSTVSDIIDRCGITPGMDYKLQKEYYHLGADISNARFYGLGILFLFIVFLIVASIAGGIKSNVPTAPANPTEVTTNRSYDTEDTVSSSMTSLKMTTETTSTETTPKNIIQDGLRFEYDGALEGYVVVSAEEREEYVIPDAVEEITVVAIGKEAFKKHEDLKKVELPSTIVEVREGAFSWCSSLESFVFPEKVTVIDSFVLWYCKSLKKIQINGSITSIGRYAFERCAFTSIKLPDSLVSIGDGAFLLTDIKKITIPEGVTSIGNEAFKSCTKMKTISLPDSLENIGKQCFRWSGLTSVVVPKNVKKLRGDVFWQCGSLKKIKVSAECEISGLDPNGYFYGCDAKVKRYK